MNWPSLRGTSLAFVPFALAAGSLSFYAKDIRLELYGTDQERAIADIEGRAGTYRIDETLPGKPIVKVDLSFAEIDGGSIKLVGALPRLRYLNLLETDINDGDLEPIWGLTELRSLNLMATHLRSGSFAAQ